MAWVVLAGLAAARGGGEELPGGLAAIRSDLQERVETGELPSVAVGVLRDGRIVWREGFGWADREAGTEATPETVYGLASLGKSITASAVLALVDRGELSLEAPIGPLLAPAHLRRGGGGAEPVVTLRQVLRMTAGVPHGNYTYDRAADAAAVTGERMVEDRGVVIFAPGARLEYSNFTFALLERVLERTTGLTYPEALEREVFAPLGMRRAFVAETTAPEGTAARYAEDGERLPDRFPRPRSSRAVNASVDDLLRYAAFHLGTALPGQRSIYSDALRESSHVDRTGGLGGRIAAGWGSFDLPDGELWLLSNGRDQGVQSTLAMLPERDLAVVVLANVTGDATDGLASSILDALAPGFLAQVDGVMAEYETWSAGDREPAALDGTWRGFVETPSGRVPIALTLVAEGTSTVALGEAPPVELSGERIDEQLLVGSFEGLLVLEELPDGTHRIDLGLHPEGDRLEGTLTAVFDNDRGSFALPAYAELERAPDP
ncbi:MAG: serine hydrolase domain-containing protein [Thermoanaerobaculia bacterium]